VGEASLAKLLAEGGRWPLTSRVTVDVDVGVMRRILLESGVAGLLPRNPLHFGQRPVGDVAIGQSIVLCLRVPDRLGWYR
jgi:hypothetical protein